MLNVNTKLVLPGKFVNVRNGGYFHRPTYELVEVLENKEKNTQTGDFVILAGPPLPQYTIIKIYKNSWGQKLRFYDFSNCVFSFSPCMSCGLSPTKTAFSNGTCRAVDTLAQSSWGFLTKNKKYPFGYF